MIKGKKVKITKVTISKTQLAAMPEAERIALILMGHAFNEINVLRKLLMITGIFKVPASQIVDHVQAGQVLIIMRMLLGKCFEAWLMFTRRVQPLRAQYLPRMDAAAKAKVEQTLSELYAHFISSRFTMVTTRTSSQRTGNEFPIPTLGTIICTTAM